MKMQIIFLLLHKFIKYVFGKPIGLYLNNLQKMANMQKSKHFMRNQVIKQKMCKQKIIHFLKALAQRIQICKNICKNFKT